MVGASGAPRLAPQPYEWIDRSATVDLTFEGHHITAFAGDCVASALWANGQRVLGYSAKLRRPRGLHGGAVVYDAERGLLPLESTLVRPGMRLGRVHHEVTSGAVPRWAHHGSKLAPGGLYDPARNADPHFEREVRAWVGLQAPAPAPGPDGGDRAYGKRHEHTELLVVGAGLAGMAAALAAAESRVQVMLVEADRAPGGLAIADEQGRRELARMLERIAKFSHLSLRVATSAVGIYADKLVALVGPAGLTKVRAAEIVLATGTADLPAVFRNNDLPGVLTYSLALRLVHRYAVAPGHNAVVLTTGDEGHRLASDLLAKGIRVAGVVDCRQHASAPADAPCWHGALVEEAHPSLSGVLEAVTIRSSTGQRTRLDCDVLIVSAGVVPADQLAVQARQSYQPALVAVPSEVAPGVSAVGRLCEASHEASMPVVPHVDGACFVDLDEDVDLVDIAGAVDEGFDQSGLLTAYTKVGRGYSQGRFSHVNALRTLATMTGAPLRSLGRALSRPPLHPVPMAMLAGRSFTPRRRTPVHDWHAQHGAQFLMADEWERPAFYGPESAREAIIASEVRAVREGVGLIDVGTLGKLELVGRDAVALLERVYTGRFADLRVGASRYAVMCDESGVIIDDGLVSRLADDRYYVTTTTSASGPVYRELQRWILQFGLEVGTMNLTGALTAFNLAGPAAPAVIARIADDRAGVLALPFLGAIETTLRGVPVRVIRAGFVGEVGYELHLPASAAWAVWQLLIEMGRDAGLRPFGVAAQRMLRLEKGHLILGQDTDALTIPREAGLQWAVKDNKPFFVGQRSLRIRTRRAPTRTLVGFELASRDDRADRSDPVNECDLVMDRDAIVGRVTSVGHSPTLGKTIGLAFVAPPQAEPGASFSIRVARGRRVNARVAATPFYDPENARQRHVMP